MTEELDALKANDVWEIVVPPGNAHVLHNKWVYRTKTDANGDIEGTRPVWSFVETNKCS